MPDPLVGDSREPGRWGPRGTHVSHFSNKIESDFFYDVLYIAPSAR
jgi:hypothetical protein